MAHAELATPRVITVPETAFVGRASAAEILQVSPYRVATIARDRGIAVERKPGRHPRFRLLDLLCVANPAEAG